MHDRVTRGYLAHGSFRPACEESGAVLGTGLFTSQEE
jgi:hypothetical protein